MQTHQINPNCKDCEIAPCFSLSYITGIFWKNRENQAREDLAHNNRICPDCSSKLDEDWGKDIDEDGEVFEFKILSCPNPKCNFQITI